MQITCNKIVYAIARLRPTQLNVSERKFFLSACNFFKPMIFSQFVHLCEIAEHLKESHPRVFQVLKILD